MILSRNSGGTRCPAGVPALGDHGFDLAAKGLLIELKCGLALAVECEIRIQLHSVLLWLETICLPGCHASVYSSAMDFMSARPASNSLPSRLSILTNIVIALAK